MTTGRPEGLLALAADPAGRHLLVFSLGLGRKAGRLGPGPRELAAALAGKDVEAPRLGDPVVRGVHGALQDALDELPRHRVLLYRPDALTRLYGRVTSKYALPIVSAMVSILVRPRRGKARRIHLSWRT